jgi:acetone carboxylase gamma subunit
MNDESDYQYGFEHYCDDDEAETVDDESDTDFCKNLATEKIDKQAVKTINNPRFRSSDQELKDYIWNFRMMDLLNVSCSHKSCQYDGRCMERCNLQAVLLLRLSIWGSAIDAPINSSERRNNYMSILKNAFSFNEKSLKFKIGEHFVCESAFLLLSGINSTKNISDAPNQWKRIRDWVIRGESSDYASVFSKQSIRNKNVNCDHDYALNDCNGRYARKYAHARTYILYASDVFCDASPYEGKKNNFSAFDVSIIISL